MYEVAIYVWPEHSLRIVIGIIKRATYPSWYEIVTYNVFLSIHFNCETQSLYSRIWFRELTLLLLFISLCLSGLVCVKQGLKDCLSYVKWFLNSNSLIGLFKCVTCVWMRCSFIDLQLTYIIHEKRDYRMFYAYV